MEPSKQYYRGKNPHHVMPQVELIKEILGMIEYKVLDENQAIANI